jgi:hypothetical protein
VHAPAGDRLGTVSNCAKVETLTARAEGRGPGQRRAAHGCRSVPRRLAPWSHWKRPRNPHRAWQDHRSSERRGRGQGARLLIRAIYRGRTPAPACRRGRPVPTVTSLYVDREGSQQAATPGAYVVHRSPHDLADRGSRSPDACESGCGGLTATCRLGCACNSAVTRP